MSASALTFPVPELSRPDKAFTLAGVLLASVLGLGLFLSVERRAPNPGLDLTLFSNRAFALGNLTAFILGGPFLGSLVFLPLFMVNVVGLSATHSGMTRMPLSLGMVAGHVLAGQLVSRLGCYRVLMLGALGLLLANGLLAFTPTPDSTQASVTLKMVMIGLGMGPTLPLYTLAVQNAVPSRQTGVATSAVTFFRQRGATVGVALLGTVFAGTLSTSMHTGIQAAVKDLPAVPGAQLVSLGHADRGQERAATQRFDAVAMKERIRASGEVAQAQQVMLDTVDREDRAIKGAFSQATFNVYLVSILFVLLGLLLTFFLPEVPLRKTHREGAEHP